MTPNEASVTLDALEKLEELERLAKVTVERPYKPEWHDFAGREAVAFAKATLSLCAELRRLREVADAAMGITHTSERLAKALRALEGTK